MRIPAVVLSLLFTSQALFAQELSVGVKVGPNAARQVGWCCGESNPFDSRLGLTGGATGTIGLVGPIGLQVELLYAGKGMRGSPAFQLRLNYLEAPVLMRVMPARRQAVRPVILLGVAPAFELSCTARALPPEPASAGPTEPVDCGDYRATKVDLGLVGGIGADVRVRGVVWTAEARYTYGIRDLTPQWDFVRTTNRSLAFLLGIRFGRG